MPSETPSCTPSSAPTPSPSINLFYPDQSTTGWESGCLNDGAYPGWMDQNPSTWLFSTLDKCCAQHFSWNYDYCMGTHDDTCARAYWYPDWEGGSSSCVRDGDEPLYMTQNPGQYLFSTKVECCEEHYSWDIGSCMGGDASGASGGLYYPDWTSGDEECKNDGNAPDYMVNNQNTWLYTDKGDCCARYFNYKLGDCMGTTTSSAGSDKYFPDWAGDNEGCLQDTGSTRAPDYMSGSTTWLFDDLESCCSQHYSWNKNNCMGTSSSTALNGSEQFYVLWKGGANNADVCVKDCAVGAGTNCGGFAESWDTKYDTQAKCCSERVSYAYKDCMKGV